jgi:hypothetical protein
MTLELIPQFEKLTNRLVKLSNPLAAEPSEQLLDLYGGNRRNLWMRDEISLSGRPTDGETGYGKDTCNDRGPDHFRSWRRNQ